MQPKIFSIRNGFSRVRQHSRMAAIPSLLLLMAAPAFAQQAGGGSPWENAVGVLEQAFTGPIATGLSLVAIVVGGRIFAPGSEATALPS